MDWHTSLWVLIAALGLAIVSPILAHLIWGKEAVCAQQTHSECFKAWLSALAGPLAILAAILAAWPVWEQLEESRAGTRLTQDSVRLASASVISIQEANLTGIMRTFQDEDHDVHAGVQTLFAIDGYVDAVTGELKASRKPSPSFQSLKQKAHEFIDASNVIVREMDGKFDKDTVIVSRKDVQNRITDVVAELTRVIAIDQVTGFNSPGYTELTILRSTCDRAEQAIDEHGRQTAAMITQAEKLLDALVKKRVEITDSVLNKVP